MAFLVIAMLCDVCKHRYLSQQIQQLTLQIKQLQQTETNEERKDLKSSKSIFEKNEKKNPNLNDKTSRTEMNIGTHLGSKEACENPALKELPPHSHCFQFMEDRKSPKTFQYKWGTSLCLLIEEGENGLIILYDFRDEDRENITPHETLNDAIQYINNYKILDDYNQQ